MDIATNLKLRGRGGIALVLLDRAGLELFSGMHKSILSVSAGVATLQSRYSK
jgi:hypothetical protein